MIYQELLECDSKTLKAMSDTELFAHFSSFLVVTRPELARATGTRTATPGTNTIQNTVSKMSAQGKEALKKLAEEGMDLSFLNYRSKKK